MSDNISNNTPFVQGIADRLEPYRRDQQSNSPVRTEYNPVLTPLHSRLRKLLDDIPTSERRQGLSLLDLQARLRGRKGRLPQIGELGAAIRRLGWQRRRRWSNEDAAFASLWYPKDQH